MMIIFKQYALSVEAASWVLFAAYTMKQDTICATLFFAITAVLRLLWEVSRVFQTKARLSRMWLAVPTLCVAYLWLTLTPAQLFIPTPMDFWSPYQAHPPLKNFQELYRPNNSINVDIIAIHGLGSNPDNAWACRNGTNTVSWLRNILPAQGFESARVLMVNHQTRWDSGAPDMGLSDHAAHLLGHIEDLHTDPERPIIFIAHSFGGILLKKSLLLALGQRPSHVAVATKAIIFLGVPHAGTGFTKFASTLACTATWRGSDTRLLNFMSENSKEIYELDKDFRRSYPLSRSAGAESSIYVCNFVEMRPEEKFGIVVGPAVKMHPGASGYPRNRWLDADHRGMNKFCSADDPNLQVILDELRGALISLRRSNSISVPLQPVKAATVRSSLGITVTQHFIGREYTLEHLHNLLWTPTLSASLNIVSIYATGGIGKTQMAMVYARNYGGYFGAILEVDGTSHVTCCASFHRIREFLARDDTIIEHEYQRWKGAEETATSGMDVEPECKMNYRLVCSWLARQHALPWLLLFDNVDDLETFDVRDFFPYDTQGKVLVTSRRQESCEWSQWKCIKLSELRREESRALFLKQLFLELPPESTAMKLLDNVLEKLGDMPLAVAQASAYVSRRLLKFRDTRHKILQKLEEELTSYETAFLEQLQKQSAVALRSYRNDSILTTWEISFQAIERRDRAAAELLQLMGFLNRRDLNPKLLRYAILPSHPRSSPFTFLRELPRWMDQPTSPWSNMHLDSCFDLYSSYSLLEYLEDRDTFSMHPLVHAWVRLRLPRSKQIYYATQAMRLVETGWLHKINPRMHTEDIFESVKEYFSTATVEENAFHLDSEALLSNTWPQWLETIIQKIMVIWGTLDDAIISLKNILTPPRSRVVTVPWRYSYALGNRMDHLDLVKWSYQEACSRLHYRHPFSLRIAGSYADILLNKGDDEVARPWYIWLVSIHTRTYGAEHPSTAEALRGIGELFVVSERYEEAEELFNKVLRIRSNTFGFEDNLTQDILRSKRRLIRNWGNRTAALSFVQELYESDHFCSIVDSHLLSGVLGLILYQADHLNSTLYELWDEHYYDCAVLASALRDFQWINLVPNASAVTCDFSLPGWCDCLHDWSHFMGADLNSLLRDDWNLSSWGDWAQVPNLCHSDSNLSAVWGPYGGCLEDENKVQRLSEKCDVWIKNKVGYSTSEVAALLMVRLIHDLTNDFYYIEPHVPRSHFERWNWVGETGYNMITQLLYRGKSELAGTLAKALYKLMPSDGVHFAYLVGQSYASQGDWEESCTWYRNAEAVAEAAPFTCDVASSDTVVKECWTSVMHWALGICHWLSNDFADGRRHIICAVEAGELVDHEVEWMLYDLQVAQKFFGIHDDGTHIITFDVTSEGEQSQFMHYLTSDRESEWATIYQKLVGQYGFDTARKWDDCFNSGYLPTRCEQFENIKSYNISEARFGKVNEAFTKHSGNVWRIVYRHMLWTRVPLLRNCNFLQETCVQKAVMHDVESSDDEE